MLAYFAIAIGWPERLQHVARSTTLGTNSFLCHCKGRVLAKTFSSKEDVNDAASTNNGHHLYPSQADERGRLLIFGNHNRNSHRVQSIWLSSRCSGITNPIREKLGIGAYLINSVLLPTSNYNQQTHKHEQCHKSLDPLIVSRLILKRLVVAVKSAFMWKLRGVGESSDGSKEATPPSD